jgi:hypothetical protein
MKPMSELEDLWDGLVGEDHDDDDDDDIAPDPVLRARL